MYSGRDFYPSQFLKQIGVSRIKKRSDFRLNKNNNNMDLKQKCEKAELLLKELGLKGIVILVEDAGDNALSTQLVSNIHPSSIQFILSAVLDVLPKDDTCLN